MKQRQSSVDCRRRLEQCQAIVERLRQRKSELELELKEVNAQLRDYAEDSRIHDSRLKILRKELAEALVYERWLTRRAVRVCSYAGGQFAYEAFLKITPKFVFLERQDGREMKVDPGRVKHEDLVLILHGKRDALPLISEVCE